MSEGKGNNPAPLDPKKGESVSAGVNAGSRTFKFLSSIVNAFPFTSKSNVTKLSNPSVPNSGISSLGVVNRGNDLDNIDAENTASLLNAGDDEKRRALLIVQKSQNKIKEDLERKNNELDRLEQVRRFEEAKRIKLEAAERSLKEAQEKRFREQEEQKRLSDQKLARDRAEALVKENAEIAAREKVQREAEEKAEALARQEILDKLIPSVQQSTAVGPGISPSVGPIVSPAESAVVTQMGANLSGMDTESLIPVSIAPKSERLERFTKHMHEKLLPNELVDLGSTIKPLLLSSPKGFELNLQLSQLLRRLQNLGADDFSNNPMQEIDENFVNKIITNDISVFIKSLLSTQQASAHQLILHQKNLELLMLDAYKFGFETQYHALHDPYCADVRARLKNVISPK